MAFERVYTVKCGDIFYTTDVDKNVKPGEHIKTIQLSFGKYFINEDLGICFGSQKR